VLVDECDASVPAHWGIYDNANFGYRNTAYYCNDGLCCP
jgi:xylan 1,4-beta-xylosidase